MLCCWPAPAPTPPITKGKHSKALFKKVQAVVDLHIRRSTSDWGDIYKIIGFRVCDVSIIIRELPGGGMASYLEKCVYAK